MPVPSVNVLTFPKILMYSPELLFEAPVVKPRVLNLDTQEQGQHKLYIKQKQLNPAAIPGIAPAWMVTKCTWKSP